MKSITIESRDSAHELRKPIRTREKANKPTLEVEEGERYLRVQGVPRRDSPNAAIAVSGKQIMTLSEASQV